MTALTFLLSLPSHCSSFLLFASAEMNCFLISTHALGELTPVPRLAIFPSLLLLYKSFRPSSNASFFKKPFLIFQKNKPFFSSIPSRGLAIFLSGQVLGKERHYDIEERAHNLESDDLSWRHSFPVLRLLEYATEGKLKTLSLNFPIYKMATVTLPISWVCYED